MTITTLLTFATVTITGILSVIMLRSSLIQRMDAELKDSSSSIARVVFNGHQTGTSQETELLRTYGAILSADNVVLAQSTPTGGGDTPDLNAYTLEELRSHGSAGFTIRGTNIGSPGWRVMAFDVDNTPKQTLIVAQSMERTESVSNNAAALLSSIGLITTLTATLIAYLVVTRAFSPLQRVERTAAKIAEGDLSQRVTVENPSTEIGRLSRSLNAMLAHIESAFAAQAQTEASMRRFISDASHELRTPLVTIRGYSELYSKGAMSTERDVAAAMGRIESEARRMGALVEDLLTLARADEKRPLDLEPIDLYILALDAAADAQAGSGTHPVTVVGLEPGQGPRPAPVIADDARMRQVVTNLLTNAMRYTPEGTRIELAVGQRADGLSAPESVLEIRDHGPGISEADQARVFERFYRSDESRHRQTGGTGLGLAIVAAITAQHGGTVRLSTTPGGGATFTVALPYRPFEDDVFDDAEDDDAADGPNPAGSGGPDEDIHVSRTPGS
ncbi:HAMP domain-containing sensor histidine kinase [Falsarthrobacter nasiphocae]|uniref:histidine kinase n=1 Tax=Falsarthrobacter nasiphocae TaxID=189863 RepID=A0AAE3YGI9_9MICC|nr:HAMP domain-containing sensor histidine kinase [Falsarthrobacter nasiphocae]MDR6891740.1 two-component system OmpR family sensor kinase [Falsarthrobacter nasiphocae]